MSNETNRGWWKLSQAQRQRIGRDAIAVFGEAHTIDLRVYAAGRLDHAKALRRYRAAVR